MSCIHLRSLYRLCLRDIVKQNSENLPCVLVKCDKDGKPIGSAPGLQVSGSSFAFMKHNTIVTLKN